MDQENFEITEMKAQVAVSRLPAAHDWRGRGRGRWLGCGWGWGRFWGLRREGPGEPGRSRALGPYLLPSVPSSGPSDFRLCPVFSWLLSPFLAHGTNSLRSCPLFESLEGALLSGRDPDKTHQCPLFPSRY